MRTALRWAGTTLLFLLIAACFAPTVIPPFLDRIYYRGPASGHFDGARFFNPDRDAALSPSPLPGRGGLIGRFLSSDDRPPWPETVEVAPSRPAARVAGEAMVATWIGHASYLVQTAGINILTDPIWSDRAGPFGIGPRRVAAPGIGFDDLPRIDLVLISHNHYDHLDLETLRRLWDRDRPIIVTSLGNETILRSAGIEAVALDWGGRLPLRRGIEVAVNRNHHWGSRWFTDRNRALWSSFVVRLPGGGNLFFAGDTGFGDGRWANDAAALGPIRLALIPIGAFRFAPGQMETGSHIGPAAAVDIFSRLGASRALAMHWGTFRLSSEAWSTPPRLLVEALRCGGDRGGRFTPVRFGAPVPIPVYSPPPPLRAPDRGAILRCLAANREVAALR